MDHTIILLKSVFESEKTNTNMKCYYLLINNNKSIDTNSLQTELLISFDDLMGMSFLGSRASNIFLRVVNL